MKLVAFLHHGQPGVGQLSADGRQVQPFDLAVDQRARGALPILEMQAAGLALPGLLPTVALADVHVTAPLPMPRRNIFCVGKNYHAHAAEFSGSGFDSSAKANDGVPSDPIIFTKVPESVVGPGAAIALPPAGVSTAIDYEAELAIIIGKGGKGIAAQDAMDHVWGYTIVNDVTARDWQNRHQQWHMGKSFDSFCPMGPCLVSRDACDGSDTRIRCFVNGELRQDASTTDLIFGIPKLIETLSAGITLYPGDVIATGTPVGVGIGFKPPRYLVAGDVVRIEIDGIGVLENPVR